MLEWDATVPRGQATPGPFTSFPSLLSWMVGLDVNKFIAKMEAHLTEKISSSFRLNHRSPLTKSLSRSASNFEDN